MKYGCIGEKLGHSFSKEIHNRLFNYEYELKEIEKQNLEGFMLEKNFCAVNVTIPYKEKVIPYLDYVDETAQKIGAVNTIVNKDGKLCGYNTDFLGLRALILKNKIRLENKKVLILGSGGTAKTAYAVCKSLNAREVYKLSRQQKDGCITYDDAYLNHTDADVLINTTPLGMYPNTDAAADINAFINLSAVVDAVYNPLSSKLVCKARERGILAVGGLYMLVAQAAFAAELFTGQKVEAYRIDEIFKKMFLLKQNIVLIGMPSCGKSTIGKRLAKELKMNFVDTDAMIQEKTGKTPSQIITEQGEKVFRDIEAEAVFEASRLQHTVIATGGGAVLRKDNIAFLKQNGRIYYIDRPLDFLTATNDRPLSSTREAIERRYNERYEIYLSAADVKYSATDSLEQNVNNIKEDFLNENTCN